MNPNQLSKNICPMLITLIVHIQNMDLCTKSAPNAKDFAATDDI